jgi:hypothetical protein
VLTPAQPEQTACGVANQGAYARTALRGSCS